MHSQFIYRSGMDNKQIIEKYAREIVTWISNTLSNEDVPKYYEKFCERTSSFSDSGMQICFDERVVKSILCLFDTLQFQTFDEQTYPCRKRQLLILIANQLYLQKFINRRHLSEIREKQNQTMLNHRIKHFFQKVGQQYRASNIREVWKKQIGFQITYFWQWIIVQQIRHQVLIYLFEYTLKMDSILSNRVLQSPHFQQIQRQYQNYMFKEESIKKSLLDTQSQSRHLVHQSGINQALFDIAHEKSLYLNKAYQPIIKTIRAFIKDLSDILFPQKQAYFEPFGSIRNKMALVDNYDVDLTVIFSKQRRINYNTSIKINDLDYLQSLRAKIQYQQFDWLVDCYMGKRTGPFAYMKLSVDPIYAKKYIKIPNLSKIDMTVDNKNAIINSEFISKFAQKEEILAFCILVKSWAKNLNVINAKQPMEGLSCYGLILMCLFFLMKTGQIDYIEESKSVKIERCEMKKLNENFYQFLKFYSKNGQFRNQKMTVCLMKRIEHRFIYDQKLIINMYDHLDNSNPGRLTIDYIKKFDSEISKAIEIMQSKEYQMILEMFKRS